jgi:hypothetical protein
MVGPTAKNDRLSAIVAFVIVQQFASNDAIATVPAEVTRFLDEHTQIIDAIEAHLLGRSELSWERDLGAGFAQPHPDFMGHRYLQGVLLARAIDRGRRGHIAEADTSLEASWILNRSLGSRHELTSQLNAVAVAAMENGALRALPVPPVRWADRVLAKDFPTGFSRAFQAEAFLYTHFQAVQGVTGVPAVYELSMAAYSDRVRMTTELLRDHDDPCSLDLEAVSRAAQDALPRRNWARTAIENLPRAWGAVTIIRLDGELTRRVIEARGDAGEIIHARDSAVASTVCKGVSWIRTSAGDGRVTIAAKPAPPNDMSRRPWSFSFGPTS